ncbi:hypothetical protein Agub_g4780 [Astrephomene gubernaculifera]|uniref:YTH domain-containing protein n=1 Tax=Astrephomene gubernaculifera TaxID=47775 RepID=A0AAD3HK14_9CHLO|nr:hypothetical protein Agub_g4780 [Astrephomene gubernaculifera]
MDEEEALLYDDYEPDLEQEADLEPPEAVPAIAEPEQVDQQTPEPVASSKEEVQDAPPRGEEAAGPSGRGGLGGGVPNKIKRGQSSSQGVRYFIIRSSTLQNIFISVRVGAWATTRQNDDKLDDAFRKSREVRLLYSVTGSNAFQGYAVMRSPIGRFGRPVIWENGKQFGNPFAVEWRVLFDLPHSECEQIRNPYNENRPVFIARDGTEIPQEQGDLLVRLMQERAAAAGAKPPRQQLALMDPGARGGPAPGMMGRGGGMLAAPGGRLGPGPRGAGMGPGMRPPLPGPGMDSAMLGLGGVAPGLLGPMGSLGMGANVNMEQVAAMVAMNNVNPAAVSAMLQHAGLGMQPGVGGMQQQQPSLQAIASAMVATMATLPPEQQALAMSAITASNPLLAEAMAAVVSGGGPGAGGPAGMQPGVSGMGAGGAMASMGGQLGGVGPAGAMNGSSGLGHAHRQAGAMGRNGNMGEMGGARMLHANQQLLQQQQAQQQMLDFNRDDVVLEGSDGRLRSARSRSRSRSRSPVHGRRGGGGGVVDFSNMTYEQYLQQYGRVQQEVRRRVGGSNGRQRSRSPELSPRYPRETSPASQVAVGQGRMEGGGGMAVASGASAGTGMGAKPGGQPYTEEEYIRVTQMWYASRGQAPPSESYIRQHYRQMLSQLQQQR